MMTLHLNQHHDREDDSMKLCARSAFLRILLTTAVLVGWAGNRCTAQNARYPNAYPATTSYPTSYPVDDSASTFQFTPIVRNGSLDRTNSKNYSRPGTNDRLASTNAFNAQPRFSLGGTFGSRTPAEPVSPYGLTMIQSARQSAAQFRMIAESASPIISKIAGENGSFADQWASLAETHAALSKRVGDASTKLRTTTRDFADVNSKLAKYGLTPTVGLLLRNKKEQLDAWQIHDSQILFTSEEIGRSRQEQLELEMVRFDGADPARETAEILADAPYDRASAEYAALASQVQGLLIQRSQWLAALGKGYQDYQQKLGELDSATTAFAKLTRDYRKLIDRHITWIRSGDPISAADVRDLKSGLAILFDARRSADFGPTLDRKLNASVFSGIGLLALVVLILVARWRAKSWLVGIGTRKRMREATADSRKVAAGVLTTLVALAFPSVLFVIGRWLGTGVVSESTLHASSGFFAASLVALMIEVPRQLLRTNGYFDKHVDVELPRRAGAARYLTLVGFGLVVAAYAITVMGSIDHGVWRDSVARLGFMTTMLLVAWTAHLALRPRGGLLEPLIAKFGGSVIHRIRFVIYLVGVGFPLSLVALSALGYGFTANELIVRAIITLVSLAVAATLWAGVKILSARAWQMLTGSTPPPRQFDEYGEIKTETETVTGALGEHALELKHQLAFLCQCALVVGAVACFGLLWLDIFPNVRMGNPVVWNVQDTLTQSSVDAAGKTITSSVVETTPVTALHLLLAAATMFVAFQLAKLLPALFDALVLQRVSFDEGMEHVSFVMGRCLLFGVGCLIACKLIGVRWQAIQWLAVGLTVGLGFGLQDMVRNLFGGLIVLFEKPARLGDLITVGQVTGRVATQKFRTTVLSDDDGREVIVPNKKFVSEEVVNWMGAGRLSVIPLEVAVKRDERPADICRTLQELVIEQQHVLLTPAPQATLVCVGQRSQRIEVRAWIEEGQDAARFRDSLLKIVRNSLAETNLLSETQPSQPTLPDVPDESLGDQYRGDRNRSRRRSA